MGMKFTLFSKFFAKGNTLTKQFIFLGIYMDGGKCFFSFNSTMLS